MATQARAGVALTLAQSPLISLSLGNETLSPTGNDILHGIFDILFHHRDSLALGIRSCMNARRVLCILLG